MKLMQAHNQETRRSFYISVIYGAWAVIGALLSVPALAYLFSSGKRTEQEEFVEVGDISRLPLNTPQEMVFRRRRKDGWKIISEKATAWVTRVSDSEVVAFAPQCTHLGCAYHWDEKNHNFLCPCHTSTFGLDGRVLAGPAPRPLDRYRVRIDGGRLWVGDILRSAETNPVS
jgi:menaquinol-cytochrome c reductase iron-sulfur subunit